MTLASVRDKLLEFDKTSRITGREHPSIRILDVVRMLEDDPQFKLPEQIEALTKYCDDIQRPSDPHYCGDEAEGTAYDIARRLRRMLAPRRCPTCGLRPAPVIAKNARFTATIESAFGERFCEGHP